MHRLLYQILVTVELLWWGSSISLLVFVSMCLWQRALYWQVSFSLNNGCSRIVLHKREQYKYLHFSHCALCLSRLTFWDVFIFNGATVFVLRIAESDSEVCTTLHSNSLLSSQTLTLVWTFACNFCRQRKKATLPSHERINVQPCRLYLPHHFAVKAISFALHIFVINTCYTACFAWV